MKGDTLFYRFPRGEKQQLYGTFNQVDDLKGKNGFVVTDFEMNEKFIFVQKQMDSQLFYLSDNIICETKKEYFNSAHKFLEVLKERNLSKAIYSRVKQIENSFEVENVFTQLCESYPDAFVYLISSPLFGTWVGATPEILLESNNGNAKTVAIAGTLAKKSSSEWSQKELNEQQYVTDFVERQLESFSIQKVDVSERGEIVAGPVKHLWTQFKFELLQDEFLPFVKKLHPTPAVSGLPRAESLKLIERIEKHSRKFYAGIIGYVSNEESKLYVNIRCAEIQEDFSFLYVGGGYTKDSDIEKEWEETERKAETLLKVMQKK